MTDDGTSAETRVKVVYCGGCNPHIDRGAVAQPGLPVDDPEVPEGSTVRLSGCQRACASDHQLVADGDERCTDGAPLDEPAAPLSGQAGAGAGSTPPALTDHPSSWWRASWSTACPRRRTSSPPP